MKLPEITIIRKEDLPESPEWITKILQPLNKFFKSIYTILDKNVTFDDNVTSQKITLTLKNTDLPYKVSTKLIPFAVLIAKIEQKDLGYHNTITNAVSLDWSFNDGFIIINDIVGITAATKYELRLLVV